MICAAAPKLYFGAVARRIEIELTSARPDGTWTWRAAGALNPRGALDATLLYAGAKAGDVVRAEAEFGIDGITVISVEPPRAAEAADPNRIELIERPVTAAVTTQLAATRGRAGPERGGDRRRDEQGSLRRPGRPPQRPGPGSPHPGPGPAPLHGDDNGKGAHPPAQGDGAPRSERPTSARPRFPERPDRGARPPRADRAERPYHAERTERTERTDGRGPLEHPARSERPSRPPRPIGGPGRSGPGRPATRAPQTGGAAGTGSGLGAAGHREAAGRGDSGGGAPKGPSAHRQRRLNPGNAHRNAMLESLPVEQQPIAQQLLRGGIPAVRTALHFERERAREEGRPEPSTEGVMALAESLVSRVKAAEWRDRAESAIKAGDDLAMRDLRSLVSGSDAARDEASRGLAVTLRELLERRVEAHHVSWAEEVAKNLDQGHVARALRLSSRPPDASARFSAELAKRLRDAASAALSTATPPDHWLSLLEAVIESPVRRTVKPQGLPANPSPELLGIARQHCGRVPGLAPLLGISVPPPPGPARPIAPMKVPPRRPTRPPRPNRPLAPGRPLRGAAAKAAPSPVAEMPAAGVPHPEAAVAEAPVAEVPYAEVPVADVARAVALSSTSADLFPAEVAEVEVAEAELPEAQVAEAPEMAVPSRASDDLLPVEVAEVEVADDVYDAADLAALDEVGTSTAGEPAAR